LGTPLWLLFLVPLMVVYVFGVLALWIAYNRMRCGLSKSFLPRLKLLVSNTTNVFALALFWLFFLVVYACAFFYRDSATINSHFTNLLFFTFGSKGFSCLVVWIAVSNSRGNIDDEKEQSIDTNMSLRGEVLQFATAGIRSAANAGPSAESSGQGQLVFRPPPSKIHSQMLITPVFFLHVMLGHEKEIKAVSDFVNSQSTRQESANNPRQSVNTESLDNQREFCICLCWLSSGCI
jgi:hypothetical protein